MKILYKSPRLCVFQSALFQTNATVVNTDDCIIVVDPNWLPDEIAAIKKHVKRCGNKPIYLLFTHSDYDHIIGYGAFPEAMGVIASRAFVENSDKEKNLEQIRTFDDDYYIVRDYEIAYPQVTHVIEHDNQELFIGDTKFNFFLAPGHNPDGIFTIVDDDIFIAGDYLCSVEFPYIYFSSSAYEESLNKAVSILNRKKIKIMICGHGDIVSPKNSKNLNIETLRRIHDARDYIDSVRASIKNYDKPFIFDDYILRYDFPRVMRRFHDKNVELMLKEL